MRPAWIALITAGASVWAAAAELPQNAPASTRPANSDRLSLYIQAITDSPDPSAAIQAYAKARAFGGDDVGIESVYLRRMVDFGLPEMADTQATELIRRDPDNGLAWAVSAYMHAKRGDTDAALAEIVPAAKKLPHDAFVLRTAGQLLAWYDTEADKAEISSDVKQSIEPLRGELAKRPVYIETYRQAKNAYLELANAATSQPAPAANPQMQAEAATQPEAEEESQAYPPMVVPYGTPSEPAYQRDVYAQPYGYGYGYAEPYAASYPYFAGSYPSWYPSYYASDWWWPNYWGLPSYWWFGANRAFYPHYHYPRALAALGLLRFGHHFFDHHGFRGHSALLIPSRHGFGFAGRYGLHGGAVRGQYFRPGGYPARAAGAIAGLSYPRRSGQVVPGRTFGFTRPGTVGSGIRSGSVAPRTTPRYSPSWNAGVTRAPTFRSPQFRSPVRVPSFAGRSYSAPRSMPQFSASRSMPRSGFGHFGGGFRAPSRMGGIAPRSAPMRGGRR